MKVSPEQVTWVSELAQLDLTPEERDRMVKDLNAILEHIDALNELDTDAVAPMTGAPLQAGAASAANLREDALRPSLPHQDALSNAPAHNANFFKVPKVIER